MQFYCIWGVWGGPKTSQYLEWPPFASRSATHLLHIELIRLLIVACGMLVHSSSMAVRSCWILAGTGTSCHIRRSRASQTCSMGDMFSASRNCVQILATWGRELSCCNMRWWAIFERNRPFVYKKQKCCVYNFRQCILYYIIHTCLFLCGAMWNTILGSFFICGGKWCPSTLQQLK